MRTFSRFTLPLLFGWAVMLSPIIARANGVNLVAIAEDFQRAGYADLAVTPDGQLHAVWQDTAPGDTGFEVFYSASRDGLQWSRPVRLSAGEGRSSTVRAEVDSQGQIYAMWKVKASSASLGPEMNPASSANSDNGSLRLRVLSGGGWSDIVAVGRENNVFGWFSAIGPSGEASIIWSENSDPISQSVMIWNDAATSIWRARLSGPAVRVEPVASNLAVGLFALDGYVDGHDGVRFAALGGGQVFHFGAGTLSVLREQIEGAEHLAAPRLRQNLKGEERLIEYYSPSEAIVDWPMSPGASEAVTIYQVPVDGSLMGFQVDTLPNGELALSFEVASNGMPDADLLLAWTSGGAWLAPVNITNNDDRMSTAGLISSGGQEQSSTMTWSAAYAAVTLGPNGSLDLVTTNRGILVNRDSRSTVRGLERFSGSWSYPQLFFTRLGG